MASTRPKGPYIPVDDDWRRRVDEALEDLGWSRAQLAERVGVSAGAITQLLNGDSKTSRVADQISEVLKIAPTGFASLAAFRAYQKISEIEERDPKAFQRLLEKIDRQHASLDDKDE